jgi:hypothetical protein
MHVVTKSRVEGDDGLSVQIDRGKIRYARGGRHLIVETEHGIGEISIFKNSIARWFPPHDKDAVDVNQVLGDVTAALRLLGIQVVIE